ncbi:cytochrome c [Aliivibrio fischeri]|uniref:cytochrome c n=1 Tax=Aliivibrio fischeri TaxID=668 RepID=UPI00084C46B7|nr:cytochrome c [Aliivibrio fischeri]OED52634.1 hypothetical protein BEI47_08200 [Aliivibrio fischeri]
MKKIAILSLFSCSLMANDFSGEIEQRQNNFQHLDATADQLDEAFDNEVVDWDRIIPLAKSAYLTVQEQKTLFPEGSADNSRARTKIWQQKPEFEEKFTVLAEQFQLLDKAAKNKDEQAAREALSGAYSQCRSCHISYRSLW